MKIWSIFNIPVIVLSLAFLLISVRQVGRLRFKIWQIMLGGAVSVILTGQISIIDAITSIDQDVMFFLAGMFIIGEALDRSGFLYSFSCRLLGRTGNTDALILSFLFGFGFLSALLMNDTLAIIGTPLVLFFSGRYKLSPKLLLLCLAFAVTTGSVMSPIGNPQNLLIALNSSLPNPFITFLRYLAVPTILNLFIIYLVLKVLFRKEFHTFEPMTEHVPIKDIPLTRLTQLSLFLLVALIILKVLTVSVNVNFEIKLTYIALLSALPIILFSNKRGEIIRSIDWETLIFFAAMFVLMRSVWDTRFFQEIMVVLKLDISSVPIIFLTGTILSQLISNVPFVALYMPLLNQSGAGTGELMALAAASTIAGNLLILGAASNVIIIQNSEKKGHTIPFLDFAKAGIPVTILNSMVYLGYFYLLTK